MGHGVMSLRRWSLRCCLWGVLRNQSLCCVDLPAAGNLAQTCLVDQSQTLHETITYMHAFEVQKPSCAL